MRTLASKLATYSKYYRTRNPVRNAPSRNFSTYNGRGDTLLQQSVSLLTVKDPLFKRMGASRLAQFAVDDERRMKIVEMGGARELVNMLGGAKDDRTRKEALKALSALSPSDKALGALHQAGAISVIRSSPDSLENAEIEKYKSSLLRRFQDLRYDFPTADVSRSLNS
ncbi:hypothetical protein DVH24_024399 [Malus domestica]|uniref:ARM repeat superfamily protein n=1 Tax=Malus domestica TaxID=3750 RepID=A0A498JID8_MALDO|nr:hypothetical protein DVH24_024399 [Malus domestica]